MHSLVTENRLDAHNNKIQRIQFAVQPESVIAHSAHCCQFELIRHTLRGCFDQEILDGERQQEQ